MSQNCPYVWFFGESGKEPVYLLLQIGDSILYPKGDPVGSGEGALMSFCIWPRVLGVEGNEPTLVLPHCCANIPVSVITANMY